MNKVVIFTTLVCLSLYAACTNIQLNQTQQRYWDNMNLPLRGYNGISPANPSVFSFSALGDTHIGSSGGNQLVHALQVSQADGDAFAIVAGDDSNTGQESELNTFESQIASVGMTVYPAIGNHDIFFGGWDHYKAIIGRSIYSFDAGVVHFTFLDTANGTFGEQQLEWLKLDLSTTAQTLKIVVFHFPIVKGEFSTIYKIASDEEATIFKSIMRQYGVQLVISGHYHGYGDSTIGGTRYIVSGACNNILEIGGTPEYVKVSINGSSITTREVGL